MSSTFVWPPTGAFDSVDEIGNLLIRGRGIGQHRSGWPTWPTIRAGYLDPPQSLLYFDGEPAIGLGMSTVSGGNVVKTGRSGP